MSKLWEQTNNHRFHSIEKLKRDLFTACIFHTVLYPFARMKCLCKQHLWFMSFNSLFRSMANAPSLTTANILLETPFNWGMWGVLYYNKTSSFWHTFCIFDCCSPALSQCKLLTGVLNFFVLQIILLFYLLFSTWYLWKTPGVMDVVI